jgi:AcrR family transcriptional regulator
VSTQRPLLDRAVMLAYRRRWILTAAATAFAEWGYQGATIEDVASHSGISQKTIYQLFANKEAIFLDLLESSVQELQGRSESACAGAGADSWAQVAAALSAVLDWVAGNPDAASALLCEADRAGPEATRIKEAGLRWYTDQLRTKLPRGSAAPQRTIELVVDGVASILGFRALAGDTASVPDLAESLLIFLRTPFDLEGPQSL